jgi:polyphenol oxidase
MSFSSGETACAGENRRRFLAEMGIDHRSMVMPRQVHGCRIELAGKEHRGRGALSSETGLPDTDALLTREPGLPIGVLTADCLPVFIFDPGTPSVALCHAGWRSTRERICAKTVERMQKEFGAKPRDMRCFFGPGIRPCCYTVGEDLAGIFPRATRREAGALRLDLAAENLSQLGEAGVAPDHILDTGNCTFCSGDTFFSYRREGVSCGRMLSVIMLR